MRKLLMLFLVAGSVGLQACDCYGDPDVVVLGQEGQETTQAFAAKKPDTTGYWGQKREEVESKVDSWAHKAEGWGQEVKKDVESGWDRFKAWWNNEPTA